jgi:PleD family two-component response regulator
VVNQLDGSRALHACLEDHFDVVAFDEPLTALLQIGEQPPDAIVLAADLGVVRGAEVVAALKSEPHTRHVRAVLLADGDDDRSAALEAGASAQVRESDTEGLRDTLEALMGVRH